MKRKKNEAGFTLPELMFVLVIPLVIFLKIVIVWCVVSMATAAIKTATNNCNQTWGIESVVAADWLCPK